MKKIVTVCDLGCNRSVMFAHRLKFWGNDTIPIGLKNTTLSTLEMLFHWADLIITTASDQEIPDQFKHKVILLDVGPDVYPRPFNKVLNQKASQLLKDNCEVLCQS